MDIINSSGKDTQTRTGTGGNVLGPRSPLQPAKAWTHCAAGAIVKLPTPTDGISTVEFQLPNGRTLVQAVDARTERVELVRDHDGSYRTVITSAQSVPKTAAGHR